MARDDGEVAALTRRLAHPFDVTEVRWKPQTVNGSRALVVAFVDARVIQDRLDEVVGVEGWQDHYECLPDGAVVCRLKVKLGNEWITKEDVGGQSEQPDEGDRRKAAFSDALKRAAVKFGIGRYLYRLKPQWVDYDPKKRQVIGSPRLLEGPSPARPQPEPPPSIPPKGPPRTGEELQRRLVEKDRQLADRGVCQLGELVRHVLTAGEKNGLGRDFKSWSEEAIRPAIDEVKAFEARHRPGPAQAA
jgi:hypothetical protein